MSTQPNPRRRLLTGLGMGAAAAGLLGWSTWLTQGIESSPPARKNPRRFPNTRLYTHEGREVRFYDDLIRNKLVVINMMYMQCEGICPRSTRNLLQVQAMLGARAGRDVFMYSITLKPEQDKHYSLKKYVEFNGIKPGWLFLTGTPEAILQLRYRLGFYDPDPAVDGDNATHTGMVRIGHDAYDRWTMAPSLAQPSQILSTINHVDRAIVRTGLIKA